MKRLNEKELREEYIHFLKSERLEEYLIGFVIGILFGVILMFAQSYWKLFCIIPLIVIIFAIKKIKETNMLIQINK